MVRARTGDRKRIVLYFCYVYRQLWDDIFGDGKKHFRQCDDYRCGDQRAFDRLFRPFIRSVGPPPRLHDGHDFADALGVSVLLARQHKKRRSDHVGDDHRHGVPRHAVWPAGGHDRGKLPDALALQRRFARLPVGIDHRRRPSAAREHMAFAQIRQRHGHLLLYRRHGLDFTRWGENASRPRASGD